ncbi:hypothetical protein JXA84_01720 [candidate division WOR-3 bacterium]|nr:hypothetical protein [candidate division WOR-3 bacterium]
MTVLFGCSVPEPVDLTGEKRGFLDPEQQIHSDTLRVIVVNNASLFQPVATGFIDQNLREIDSFLSMTGRIYKIEKANSFFSPPENFATRIFYTTARDEDTSDIMECLAYLSEIFLRKYSLEAPFHKCLYFSPGRIFFRPSDIYSSNTEKPIFIHASCRSIEKERGALWPRHRKEWDDNILFMSCLNDISVASSRAEETLPQYMNILSDRFTGDESLGVSLPSEVLKEDRVILILGKDASTAMGFR